MDDEAVLISILCGFPDRVARRRAGKQLLLSTGVAAEVEGSPSSYEFLVAIDVEDRKDRSLPGVRMTSRIEPEWLIDLFPDRVRERSDVEWNRASERVEFVSALLYDDLVIQETRGISSDEEVTAELLYQKAIEAGVDRFVDREALDLFLTRIDFAGLGQPDVLKAFRNACNGLSSFAELKRAGEHFISLLEQAVDMRLLRERAPESVRLATGRQAKIHYERDKEPWIASRLQDFFGMRETPRIGIHRTPVVVHLLAPNHRAVQTTTDLEGFWARLYPEVRRSLMRRYPKHSWPEHP
jgi:ATP-dependent helicase HrpB